MTGTREEGTDGSANPAAAIRLIVSGRTEVGRVRNDNEDTFLVSQVGSGQSLTIDTPVDLHQWSAGVLLMVCDGMGGLKAGEVASRLACDAVDLALFQERAPNPEDGRVALLNALKRANRIIYEEAQTQHETRGMATTCTAALVFHDRFFVAQVGDSRAYLFRQGKLQLLTHDQSLAMSMADLGLIPAADVRKYSYHNVITQALGVRGDVRPAVSTSDIHVDDRLILCSDGIHGVIPEPRIAEILATVADVTECLEALVQAALEAGGSDNITVVLAKVEAPR